MLEAKFHDGYSILARLPYRIASPAYYAIASEVATLALLRAHGIPVPKVVGYSPDRGNRVGVEYMLMEKLKGTPLSDQWFTMDTKTRVKAMRQIVDLEARYMSITLPANGSLYYERDLVNSEPYVSVSCDLADEVVVGPSARLEWWYEERSLLNIDRGPCELCP